MRSPRQESHPALLATRKRALPAQEALEDKENWARLSLLNKFSGSSTDNPLVCGVGGSSSGFLAVSFALLLPVFSAAFTHTKCLSQARAPSVTLSGLVVTPPRLVMVKRQRSEPSPGAKKMGTTQQHASSLTQLGSSVTATYKVWYWGRDEK